MKSLASCPSLTFPNGAKVALDTNANGKLTNQLVVFIESALSPADVICSEILEVLPGLACVTHRSYACSTKKEAAELGAKMLSGACPFWKEERKRHSSLNSGSLELQAVYVVSASGKITALKDEGLKYYQHFTDLA